MTWIKSSFCNADQPMCVEVQRLPSGAVGVRDSKDPDVQLIVDPLDWDLFVAGVKAGEFD